MYMSISTWDSRAKSKTLKPHKCTQIYTGSMWFEYCRQVCLYIWFQPKLTDSQSPALTDRGRSPSLLKNSSYGEHIRDRLWSCDTAVCECVCVCIREETPEYTWFVRFDMCDICLALKNFSPGWRRFVDICGTFWSLLHPVNIPLFSSFYL